MNNEINYENNPLNGVGLKSLLSEIVDHYGFEILFAYLNINCFKTNPSIDSSIKFLKKMTWAREKVEGFYLYQFKSLPRASAEQFELPPRERIIPDDQSPSEPAELSLEDAERLNEKRAKKWESRGSDFGNRSRPYKSFDTQQERHFDNRNQSRARNSEHETPKTQDTSVVSGIDPWAKSKK